MARSLGEIAASVVLSLEMVSSLPVLIFDLGAKSSNSSRGVLETTPAISSSANLLERASDWRA